MNISLDDLSVISDFFNEGEATEQDMDAQYENCIELIENLEVRNMLRKEEDQLGAILKINSGAGGTESNDWAAMLFRMYLRWAERNEYKTRQLDFQPGDEVGVKSVTIEIEGEQAYGYLKSEKGVHRLVRISPFDANKRRHTSFALVEVIPILESEDLQIEEKDLRIDTFNASGHGGQNVQKNDTAVRIVHIPTQITVTCQSERSQLSNKEAAMKLLRSKLTSLLEEHRTREMQELKNRVSAEWGNQIRSYVLQPYTLVKDNRTGYETADVSGILEGNLDDLVWEYIGNAASIQSEETRR